MGQSFQAIDDMNSLNLNLEPTKFVSCPWVVLDFATPTSVDCVICTSTFY